MATKPTKNTPQVARARVLADLPHLGACNGDLIEGDSAAIDALAQAGRVDTHPDSVAYAESIGARVQVLAAE